MDSGDSKQSDKLVFRSEQIRDTKAKEKVNHFVNLEKRAERAAKRKAALEAKRKAALERLKEAKGKILTVTGIVAVVAVVAVGIFLYAKKQIAIRKANELSNKTESYIEYINQLDALIEKDQIDELNGIDNPGADVLRYLEENSNNENETETMKTLDVLFKLYTSVGYNASAGDFRSLIPVFENFHSKVKDEKNKAIIEIRLAELHYRTSSKDSAYYYYKEASTHAADLDSIGSFTGAYLDMVIEFAQDESMQPVDEGVLLDEENKDDEDENKE